MTNLEVGSKFSSKARCVPEMRSGWEERDTRFPIGLSNCRTVGVNVLARWKNALFQWQEVVGEESNVCAIKEPRSRLRLN